MVRLEIMAALRSFPRLIRGSPEAWVADSGVEVESGPAA
jgi:hypothetical protein